MNSRRWAMAGGVCILGAAVLLVWTRTGDEPRRSKSSGRVWASGDGPDGAERDVHGARTEPRQRVESSPGSEEGHVEASTASRPDRDTERRPAATDTGREALGRTGAIRRVAGRAAGADARARPSDVQTAAMPDGAQMMGPRRWMATVPDAERAAIRETVRRDTGYEYGLAVEDRQRAIRRIEAAARDCVETHSGSVAKGERAHVVVAFDLVVEGRRARTEYPRVRDVVGIDDPGFVRCVRQGIERVGFEARRDGEMAVKHPIFFTGGARPPGP